MAHTSDNGKRTCGSCNACCKIMGVPDVTEPYVWCQHAVPGKGCKIYRTRPDPCRIFNCMWLIDEKLGDYWQPNKCKIIVDVRISPKRIVCFHVDPEYPLRWRDEPWFSDIKFIAKAGLDGRQDTRWTTIVKIKDEQIVISR
jgi:hypothetical protein